MSDNTNVGPGIHTIRHAIALLKYLAEDATDDPQILEVIRQSTECAGALAALDPVLEQLVVKLATFEHRVPAKLSAQETDHPRLWDLVRYCRAHLLEEELITLHEYADLASGRDMSQAARRLEGYDQVRAKLAEQLALEKTRADGLAVALEESRATNRTDRAALQREIDALRTAITAEIEGHLVRLKADSFGVDVSERLKAPSPVMMSVVQLSDAMHALLFVRRVLRGETS